jgi:hypothetical protein
VKTDLAAAKKTSDDASGFLTASGILEGRAPSRIRADARAHMAMMEEKKPVMVEIRGEQQCQRLQQTFISQVLSVLDFCFIGGLIEEWV